jgi:hypothetical protein
MGSPSTFWPEALPWARQAHAGCGVLTSVILSQWAIETGYGGPDWSPNNNPGNVGSFDGQPVNKFPTLAQGVAAYIQTIRLNYYTPVRLATGWQAQCIALGNSPWASAHYRLPGGANGSELVYVVEHYNLTQYDSIQPAPPAPAPSPQPAPAPAPPATHPTLVLFPTFEEAPLTEDQFFAWVRTLWYLLRKDLPGAGEANLLWTLFNTPGNQQVLGTNGFAGSYDLVVANIHDTAGSNLK